MHSIVAAVPGCDLREFSAAIHFRFNSSPRQDHLSKIQVAISFFSHQFVF
jgi:hypothetical protein